MSLLTSGKGSKKKLHLRRSANGAKSKAANEGEIYNGKNPLFIPEIIDCLFGFLNLDTIKICRLVSHQWNDIGKIFLQKLSVVKFQTSLVQESVHKFNSAFQNTQTDDCPFTSFHFEIEHEEEITQLWPILSCIEFFEMWRFTMKEVTLKDIDILNRKGAALKSYDLSPLLPSTLTKLELDCVFTSTRMAVCLKQIPCIKILLLNECTLDIMSDIRISPIQVEFGRVKFLQNGKEIPKAKINDFVDFKQLKRAKLFQRNITLDMEGSISLDSLDLESVNILNWEKCKWLIKEKFSLFELVDENIKKMPKNQMKYKELDVAVSSISLSVLPIEIERLTITMEENDCHIKANVILPNLTYLAIECLNGSSISEYIRNFKNCSKLTELSVTGVELSRLKTSSLPSNVNLVRMSGEIFVENDMTFELETLILFEFSLTSVSNVVIGLQVRNLVWKIDDIDNESDIFDEQLKEEVLRLIALQLDSFVVGPFDEVRNSRFKKSYLHSLVDKQGEYYLFKDGSGVAIDEIEFNNFMRN